MEAQENKNPVHEVAIAPKAAGIWGTYCIYCSKINQEYTSCEFIKDAPRELVEYTR